MSTISKKEKKYQRSETLDKIQGILSPYMGDLPWIPDSLGLRLARKGDTIFATRDLPILPQHTEVYAKEAVHWATPNYLVLGVVPGEDQTREFIYYLLRRPIGLFIQRSWVQEEVEEAKQLIDTFAELSLEATGLGLLGSRDLFILMDSTSAGNRWAHVPPETDYADVIWQIGENPIDEALDFLNPNRSSLLEESAISPQI